MKITIYPSVEDAPQATGLAVIIDVFRAFSVEAYLFGNGANMIIPVLHLDDAYTLQKEHPDYILIGERGGLKPEGFAYGNSPTEIRAIDFTGKIIVHTTSNGTKGLMHANNATEVITGSFVNAGSIITYIQQNNVPEISLVSTSPSQEVINEDLMLANYIKDVLQGIPQDKAYIQQILHQSSAARYLFGEIGVPESDYDLCLDFNRFDFIIKKAMIGKQMILQKEIV